MKKILLVVAFWLFIVCSALSPVIYAGESQVVVSATGRVSIKPDMAKFGVVVKSDARTADQAAAEAAEQAKVAAKESAIAKLSALGLTADEIAHLIP